MLTVLRYSFLLISTVHFPKDQFECYFIRQDLFLYCIVSNINPTVLFDGFDGVAVIEVEIPHILL